MRRRRREGAARRIPEPGRRLRKRPFSVYDFIIEHLSEKGEDYIAGIHRAYREKLREHAEMVGDPKKYRRCTYQSFEKRVWELKKQGVIELVRVEEAKDLIERFGSSGSRPMKHYFALSSGEGQPLDVLPKKVQA